MKLIGCLKKSLLSEEETAAVLEAHNARQQNEALTPEAAEIAAVYDMLEISQRDLRGVEAAISRAQSKVMQSRDQAAEAEVQQEAEYINLAGGLDVVPEISIDEEHYSAVAGWFKGRLPTKVTGQTPRNARPSEQESITKAVYGLRSLNAPNFLFSSIRRMFVSDDGAHGSYRTLSVAVGFKGEFLEREGQRWDALRVGVVAHEIHHHLDNTENGGFYSTNSPLFDIDLKSGPGIANISGGALINEVVRAMTTSSNEQLRSLLLYPLTIANRAFKRRDVSDIVLAKVELFAQLGRVYFTNPEVMARELPSSYNLFKGFYEEARGTEDIREARDILQRHLQRAPAAGRVRHDDSGAVDRQAAASAGVGQAGAGVGRGVRNIDSRAINLEPADRLGLGTPQKELVTKAPAGTPIFGTPVKGAITVVGVHYSNATGLVTLRGDKYGSAAAGAERSRVKWAGDERVKRRVYFYAQTSDSVPKSEGLVMGPHAYRVQLNNIYDMEADSLKLRGRYKAYGTPEFMNDTWVESQILDAGYDGYVVRSFSPSPAVVVLNKDVPVQYLGNKAKEKSLDIAPVDKGEFSRALEGRRGRRLRAQPDKIVITEADIAEINRAAKAFADETGRDFEKVRALTEQALRERKADFPNSQEQVGAKKLPFQFAVIELGSTPTIPGVSYSELTRPSSRVPLSALPSDVGEAVQEYRDNERERRVSKGKKPPEFSVDEVSLSELRKAGVDEGWISEHAIIPAFNFKSQPLTFDKPISGETLITRATAKTGSSLTEAGEKFADNMASEIVKEVRRVQAAARAAEAEIAKGNEPTLHGQTAIRVAAQRAWYTRMRSLMRRMFGSAGDLMADLIGATSARTPVGTNWDQALEALENAASGQYDAILYEFRAHLDAGGNSKNYTGPLALRDGEKRYNANTTKVMEALLNLFRAKASPKTPNYAMNIAGAIDDATIDVWAARTLMRIRNILYGDTPLIPSPAEGGVSGKVQVRDGVRSVSGQFFLGQEVFSRAAKRLRMQPHELQAFLWFMEKDLWTRSGMTSAIGEGGDLAAEALRVPTERAVVGLAPKDQVHDVSWGMMLPAVDEARKSQGLVAVVNSSAIGMYAAVGGTQAGSIENASGFEAVFRRGTSDEAINNIAIRVMQAAKANDQGDAFVAVTLPDDVVAINARPGMTIYFKDYVTQQDVTRFAADITTENTGGFTAFGDAFSKPGQYRGLRFIFMPEYATDPADIASKSQADVNAKVAAMRKQVALELRSIRDKIQKQSDAYGVKIGSVANEYFQVVNGSRETYEQVAAELQAENARAGAQTRGSADAGRGGPWQLSNGESVARRSAARVAAGRRNDLGDDGQQADEVRLSRFDQTSTPEPQRYGGVDVASVEAKVAEITGKWSGKPDIFVLEEPSDAPFDIPEDARGAFYNGRVYLFASNLYGDKDVEFTLLHETAGHLGLAGILGPELASALKRIYDSNEIVRRLAGEQMAKYGYDQTTATEEALADLAGSGAAAELSGWKMFLAALRNLLRKAGVSIEMSDNDVMALLAGARRYVERGGSADTASSFSKKGPIWYSELEARVAGSMLKSAPPEQWKNTIKSLKGIKPDEIEWTGINDWLDLQQGKVTKEAVVDYLRSNGVKVDEAMLGSAQPPKGWKRVQRGLHSWEFTNGIVRGLGSSENEAAEDARIKLEREAQRWQSNGDDEKAQRFFAQAEEIDYFIEKMSGSVRDGDVQYEKYKLPGGENYRELLLTLPFNKSEEGVRSFRSSHFNEPNILAHIRFNERRDADGKRVLFIEEIQSDWAQKGREGGFFKPEPKVDIDIDKIVPTGDSMPGMQFAAINRAGDILAFGYSESDVRYQHQGLSQRASIQEHFNERNKAPIAPFVQKTEAWVALALKRMIRYASENGFDKVAFVNGEQSAERYSLEKKISKIVASKMTLGDKYEVKAYDLTKEQVLADVYPGDELPDVVGKELADRIVSATAKSPGKKVHFEGLDLKVGGEGMKTFYDEIVPNIANKVLKKLGGGALSAIDIPGPGGMADYAGQPGFDITDALRDRALEGMPLFSRGTPEWASNMPQGIQDALRKVSVVNDPETLKDRMARLFDNAATKLQQGLVDSFAPIKEISESGYMLARQSRGSDAGLEALLHYGKVRMSDEGGLTLDYERGGVVGLLQQLGGNEESKRFFAWIAGVRAERLRAEKRENLLTATDISALRSLNQGRMPDGSSRAMLYARIHKDFLSYQKSVLDLGEKAGLFSAGDRAIWENDFYVPFYRVLEDEGYQGPHNVSGLVKQRAFQKLRGGTEKVDDLLQNTLRNWAHILAAATKNRAAKEVLDAAVNAPGGAIATQIPAAQAGKKDPWIMVNGVKQYYHVDDPFILEALSSMKPSPFTGVLPDLMGKFKHALTYGVTFSPVFRINNLIRDTLSAVAVNDVSGNILRNLWQGGKSTKVGTEEYGKMLVSGALMHFGRANDESYSNNLQRLLDKEPGATILDSDQKIRDAMKGMLRWWEDTGSRVENINRVAIYQQTYSRERANGATEGAARLRAAYAARDSMDFSSIGAWPAVRALSQVVPFLNARAQGLYKLGREGFAPTGRVIYNTVTGSPVEASDASKAFRFGAAATVVSAASIMALLAYGDDDDWKKREEFDRDNWWWFKFGDKSYRIPKPFELGSIGTVAERGVEMVMAGMDAQSRERFATRLWDIVSNTLSMNPVPQMFKPVLEIWANENSFTKRPIETMGMERLSPSQRIGNNTSAVAQFAGKAEVLSPVQIDHLIQGYFGWLGANAVKLIDVAMHPAMGLPEKPAARLEEVPVVGSFVRELPTTNSRFMTEFYKRSERPLQVKADIASMRKMGRVEEANELQAGSGEELAQAKVFERAKRLMADLNGQIKRARFGAGTPEDRRIMIDRLTQRRNAVARSALLAVGVR